MGSLWKLLGVAQFNVCGHRRRQFVKALERLLLVSTAGAFFFALARNVPLHAKEFSWHPNWEYTLDRLLRYLCLIWFLAYFFVSSVNNDLSDEGRRLKDIGFDFGQSIAVLAATYALGFVITDRGFGFEDGMRAFLFSNIVLLVICVGALWLFSGDSESGELKKGLKRVRWAGVAISLIGALVAGLAPRGTCSLVVLLFLQVLLWVLWLAFFCLRLLPAPAQACTGDACPGAPKQQAAGGEA
jgi:hypothetical protein